MLNTNKVRIMTQLALFENKEGKEDMRMSKYYKFDYIRYQVVKSIICATIGYLLILGMLVIYKSEDVIKEAITFNYKEVGSYVAGGYVLVIFVYGLVSYYFYSKKFEKSKVKLNKYNKLLKELSKMYKGETQ